MFSEEELVEIAANLRLTARRENTTPFCDMILDQMGEIDHLLQFEKENGCEKSSRLKTYESLFEETVVLPSERKGRILKDKSILLKDDSGMGKMSVMRRIEWDWGRGIFNQSLLVFLVSLRLMKPHDKLEDIILRQHLQLREIPLTPEKLRRILEVYGHECLLLLDGLGVQSSLSEDVLTIIKGDSLPECSFILSSRSDLITKEIAKAFGTVIKSKGFLKDYAETFAKFFHPKQSQNRS